MLNIVQNEVNTETTGRKNSNPKQNKKQPDLKSIISTLEENGRLASNHERYLMTSLGYKLHAILQFIMSWSPGYDYQQDKKFAKKLKMDPDAFRKGRDELVKRGYIKIKKGKHRGKATTYSKDNLSIALGVLEGYTIDEAIDNER